MCGLDSISNLFIVHRGKYLTKTTQKQDIVGLDLYTALPLGGMLCLLVFMCMTDRIDIQYDWWSLLVFWISSSPSCSVCVQLSQFSRASHSCSAILHIHSHITLQIAAHSSCTGVWQCIIMCVCTHVWVHVYVLYCVCVTLYNCVTSMYMLQRLL